MRVKLLFAALYVGEGAPIGLLWWYLPTELRSRGVDVADVTALTAVLALPWAFKFLWAPMVDALRGSRFGYRGAVLVAQLGMVGTLAPLLALDLTADFAAVRGLLIAHAFCAATQDVAIDGWAIGTSRPEQRGALNAWMLAGMLFGRITFSGGALWISASIGLHGVVAALLAVLGVTLLIAAMATPPPAPEAGPQRGAAAVVRALRTTARARWFVPALLVALLGGAGFEAVGALAGPYLVDLGRAREEVGTFWTLAAMAAIPGGLLAGRLADRHGHVRTTAVGLTVLTAAIAAFVAVVSTGAHGIANEVGLVLVFAALGAFTASSYALFMDLSATAAGATTFSTFMGLTNLCEAGAARLGGALASGSGYAVGFAAPAAIALLALPALRRIARAIPAPRT